MRKRKPAAGDMESGGTKLGLEPPRRCEEFTHAGLGGTGMSVLGHRVIVTEVSLGLGHDVLPC